MIKKSKYTNIKSKYTNICEACNKIKIVRLYILQDCNAHFVCDECRINKK